MTRPACIKIDCTALRENLQVALKYATDSKVICCVKANAYGHGLRESALKLVEAGADALAVACLEEAQTLRSEGMDTPILLLEGLFDASELKLANELQLWLAVHSFEQLQLLEENELTVSNHLWIKIDTGMHRLGFSPEDVPEVLERLQALPSAPPLRLMTHFACADERDNDFTARQIQTFESISSKFELQTSLANSAAIIAWPQAHGDWVRPGFMLYGLSPFGDSHTSAQSLEPVMSFETEVIALREIEAGEGVGYNHAWRASRPSKIAVIAAGYGDGYPRNTANGCPILIERQRASTVGHVAMDMMMADVTDLSGVNVGSKVELWGKNLSVNEVAAHSGYSPYELLTRMPLRAKRIFSN